MYQRSTSKTAEFSLPVSTVQANVSLPQRTRLDLEIL